jgi:hypothetical protein
MLQPPAIPVNNQFRRQRDFSAASPQAAVAWGTLQDYQPHSALSTTIRSPWNYFWLPWARCRRRRDAAPIELEQSSIVATVGHVRGEGSVYVRCRVLSTSGCPPSRWPIVPAAELTPGVPWNILRRRRRAHQGEQQRRERWDDQCQEAQASAAVRVRWHDRQLDARHLPQKPRPDHEPELPPQEQELEERQTHEPGPPTGQRPVHGPVRRHAVPARHVERRLRSPGEPHPGDVDEREH